MFRVDLSRRSYIVVLLSIVRAVFIGYGKSLFRQFFFGFEKFTSHYNTSNITWVHWKSFILFTGALKYTHTHSKTYNKQNFAFISLFNNKNKRTKYQHSHGWDLCERRINEQTNKTTTKRKRKEFRRKFEGADTNRNHFMGEFIGSWALSFEYFRTHFW